MAPCTTFQPSVAGAHRWRVASDRTRGLPEALWPPRSKSARHSRCFTSSWYRKESDIVTSGSRPSFCASVSGPNRCVTDTGDARDALFSGHSGS